MTTEALVAFRLARQAYAVPVVDVLEILHMVSVTVLPDMPPAMLGVINYRGRVIPLLDLRQLYDVPVQKLRLNTPILIVCSEDKFLGLVVDAVEGVTYLPFEMEIASTELGRDMQHIQGVIKREDGLLPIIDLASLLKEVRNI